jgi:hypothetical protein
MKSGERDRIRILGAVLIILGVAVWGAYAVMRFGMDLDVTGRQFLLYHLAGVVPGVILRRHHFFRSLVKRLFSR